MDERLAWQATLEQGGHKIGVANSALIYNAEERCRGGVHGDDSVVFDSVEHWTGWTRPYMASTPCENHTDSNGRRYVRIEPDIRHAERVLRDLGLEGNKVKPLMTPGFKLDEKEFALRETEIPYRSCVMRLSYFSQDRAGLGEPVKCSAKSMAKPNTWPYTSPTRQTFPSSISIHVDSDFAGCRSTRRSTTSMVQMVSEHVVKHTSNLQGATGLNVSECEYDALTHGAAHGLGLKAYMADLVFDMSLQIFSDSSAARAFASR